MSSPDELEIRVSRLEHDVARLRDRVAEAGADAGAARVLASGADRDVSDVRAELRALTRVLNALRETQIEHGRRLTALEERLTVLEQRFDSLEAEMHAGFAEMRAGFATMRAGMAHIVTLLGGSPPPA